MYTCKTRYMIILIFWWHLWCQGLAHTLQYTHMLKFLTDWEGADSTALTQSEHSTHFLANFLWEMFFIFFFPLRVAHLIPGTARILPVPPTPCHYLLHDVLIDHKATHKTLTNTDSFSNFHLTLVSVMIASWFTPVMLKVSPDSPSRMVYSSLAFSPRSVSVAEIRPTSAPGAASSDTENNQEPERGWRYKNRDNRENRNTIRKKSELRYTPS